MELRTYQKEAVDAVLSQWAEGNRRTLLVMATGLGKTVCFASVIKRGLESGERALVLAHREELLSQAESKIRAVCSMDCVMEKADSHSLDSDAPITLGSVQTLANPKRLDAFPSDRFSMIIVDEAHHTASESYRRILEHFPEARVLGVTATAMRGDRKPLGDCYDSIAYEYSLPKAVHEGWLSPIRAEMVPLGIDITKVGISNGDYNSEELGTALDPYLPMIAEEMARRCAGRRTVVFMPLIRTSLKLLGILKSMGLNAEEVNGQSPDRKERLERFEKGETDILLNALLLTEGWDCPSVDCIIMLRPTKVLGLFMQVVGRGTRLSPNKSELLLLDFLWLTDRMDLCRPSCLLDAKPEIAEKVDAIVRKGEPCDLMEAMGIAEKDLAREREEALANQLRAMKRRKEKCIDPLQFAVSFGDEAVLDYEPTFKWERKPATEKQLEFLERNGIAISENMCKGKASMLTNRILSRLKLGLSTPKQIKLLERYGFEKVGLWRKSEAGRIIDRLAEIHWRLPSDFDPKGYKPKSLLDKN